MVMGILNDTNIVFRVWSFIECTRLFLSMPVFFGLGRLSVKSCTLGFVLALVLVCRANLDFGCSNANAVPIVVKGFRHMFAPKPMHPEHTCIHGWSGQYLTLQAAHVNSIPMMVYNVGSPTPVPETCRAETNSAL